MSSNHMELRRGTYRDSVRLMQISQAVGRTPGVSAALVAMATGLNLELAAGLGLAAPPDAGPNDLLVALAADTDAALAAGLEAVATELAAQPESSGGPVAETRPRTTGSAVRSAGAVLALVSTPGRYAFADAMDAIDAGASVLLFSDNVPVAQEIALKDAAAARGLLVMGPDCGTAVIGGVGLGFANVVRPGPVGVVAASGTGAQQVMCLLDAAGVGVSHCLGTGGRDLSEAVAGRSTLAAVDALDADPATELIVVVSKPPAPVVAEAVRQHSAGLATPVVFALLGDGQPDLTEAVEAALDARGLPRPDYAAPLRGSAGPARPGVLRGLFAGGTLCDEAMVIASGLLGTVRSNIPLRPEWALPPEELLAPAHGHAMVDFGDDALTAGRPHPMIDGSLRLDALARAVADPAVGTVLLDVVLGHAAHRDPAAELAPAVAEAVAAGLAVVVSLTAAADDPQGLDRQADLLAGAGAEVHRSNAAAARRAADLVLAATTEETA